MALLNHTTKIDPSQSIGEIQKMLSKHGVSAMMTEYEDNEISSVAFRMNVQGSQISYRLPCNWKAVREILLGPKHRPYLKCRLDDIDAQSQKLAWRVIKDWIESQLALVEINMVTIPQIFLPYTIMKGGKTLYDHIQENPGQFLLE